MITLRPAGRADCGIILSFIRELAEYEKMQDLVVADEKLIEKWLFDENAAKVIIAEYGGKAAGFCLYFTTYSTFVGRAGIHLEDLYVKPEFRKKGIGKRLISELAGICREKGYGRLEWCCLDWNEPAREFYKSLGAKELGEWINFRVDGAALEKLSQTEKN